MLKAGCLALHWLLLALAGLAVTVLPSFSGDTRWLRYLDRPRLEL